MLSSLALGVAMLAPSEPVEIKVMTYNVRYATAPDGENAWPHRREALIDLVRRHDPDVLGVQEALASQVDELSAALPTHSVIGVGRDDGVRRGEYSAIFYRRDKLGLSEGGTKWISDHPDQPGSIGPGAHIPRVFSWGVFFAAGGGRLLILNAHLDHESPDARLMGTRQMREFADARETLPTLLMGDYNCSFGDVPIEHVLADKRFSAAKPKAGPFGTFNAFDPKATDGPMIDHVFTSNEWEVLDAQIDRSAPNGRTPSDHFPFIVRLRLTER